MISLVGRSPLGPVVPKDAADASAEPSEEGNHSTKDHPVRIAVLCSVSLAAELVAQNAK